MREHSDYIGSQINQYRQYLSLYDRIVNEVVYTLEEKLQDTNAKIAHVLGRVKKEDSLKDKLLRKEYKRGILDIPDLAGVRVVCLYESDLEIVNQIINSEFDVIAKENKSENLGADQMGYQGFHFIVQFGSNFKGPRYNKLKGLNCEIQVRTVLQDAWSTISHHLVYKHESSIPQRMRRDLNNVMSLLEIGQGIFDTVKDKRAQYLREIVQRKVVKKDFLSQPIDHDTLIAYTQWKFPDLPTDDFWNSRLLLDLDETKYKTLKDIDKAVDIAKAAVDAYRNENPNWFTYGTDYLTKTLGFVDKEFRKRHPFGQKTIAAFEKYSKLIKRDNT